MFELEKWLFEILQQNREKKFLYTNIIEKVQLSSGSDIVWTDMHMGGGRFWPNPDQNEPPKSESEFSSAFFTSFFVNS